MARAAQQPKQPQKKDFPVEQQGGALMSSEVPDFLKNQQGKPGRGSENVGTEDIVIPRLEIVQGLSPAMKRGDPGYIDGAQQGMMNNSVTRQLYGTEVLVVPVYFAKQWLVWRNRKTAKEKGVEAQGFFGAFPSPQEAQARCQQEGGEAKAVEVIDTPQHFCLILNGAGIDDVQEVMISMPRTKAKVSRKWNSMVKLTGGDRFGRIYRLTTELEKNPQGDYYNFVVQQSGFPNQRLYQHAEALYNKIAEGKRTMNMDTSGLGGDEPGTGDHPSGM